MKTKQKFNKSKEWLIDNYSKTDNTLRDIAKMVGCSPTVAKKWLHKYEIPPKKRGGGQGTKNFEEYRQKNGSWNKGLKMEEDKRLETAIKKSAKTRRARGSNRGKKHASWKGDMITYKALHNWVTRHKGRPERCLHCGTTDMVEWANKSKLYKRDLADFIELCKACHAQYDLLDECKHGHKYTNLNTYVNKKGHRRCRQCAREQYHERKKKEVAT